MLSRLMLQNKVTLQLLRISYLGYNLAGVMGLILVFLQYIWLLLFSLFKGKNASTPTTSTPTSTPTPAPTPTPTPVNHTKAIRAVPQTTTMSITQSLSFFGSGKFIKTLTQDIVSCAARKLQATFSVTGDLF